MAISPGFDIALTGLKSHQKAIDVTGNNISNASNPDYVRERAVFSTLPPINAIPGDIGTGVDIAYINRLTDTFLFNRYTSANANLQNLKVQEEYLNEIATYFPDIQDQGLFKDLKDFFNAWQTLASNPNDGSVKVDLAYKTQKLTDTFHTLREKLSKIQISIDKEIDAHINEANTIIKNIAELNKQITLHEANGKSHANELRDKRDALEKRLKALIDVKIYKTGITSQDSQGDESVDYSKNYNITLGGYPLVEGDEYNQIQKIDNKGNINIGIQKQDFSIANITSNIQNSIIGGLLGIRGTKFDETGSPKNGIIGDLISTLDALAKGMIRSVNSIYSYSAKQQISAPQTFKPVSISNDMENIPLITLYNQGILQTQPRKGILSLNILDNDGTNKTTLNISINPNENIKEILKNINDKIYNNINNANYGAAIVNGEIKFVKGSYDSSGNFTPDNPPTSSPNVLVKDDGSLLFDSLNELEYLPLNQINKQLPLPLDNGSFDVVVYDNNGNILAKRKITVNLASNDPKYSTIQGILNQINTPNIDDNQDNDNSDDVDDYYQANIINGHIILNKKTDQNTYVGLDEDGANFGGAFSINTFFEGDNSLNINLRKDFIQNPGLISAHKAPNDGNNEVANAILQLQSQKINFYKNGTTYNNTIFEFYRMTTSSLANETQNVSAKKDAAQTLYKSVSNQYYSLSGVNIDEELINLEKYQRGYQANAKVITTINKMLDALFSI